MDDDWRVAAAAAVAEAYGIGVPAGPLEPVTGGRSHLMWRLRTAGGTYAVKQLNRSREAWWLAAYAGAAAVEETAFAHGVPMPRPVPPRRPAAPLLADVPVAGELVSVQVHEWCAGTPLAEFDTPPAILTWAGRTLAALHALPVPPGAAGVEVAEAHGLDEWRDWLDHPPPDASAGFLDTVRSFLPDIARARDLVAGQPPAAQRPAAVAHRDLKPDNVLLSAAGPVLVDWEGAGVDIAAWDAARTALAFSRSPDRGWRQAPFQRLLRAYGAAGGGRVPPAAGSFEGLLRHQLGASAWLLWRALGHRPVTPAERAAAHGHALEFLTDLRSTLAHLPEWVSWLAELPPAPPTGTR